MHPTKMLYIRIFFRPINRANEITEPILRIKEENLTSTAF